MEYWLNLIFQSFLMGAFFCLFPYLIYKREARYITLVATFAFTNAVLVGLGLGLPQYSGGIELIISLAAAFIVGRIIRQPRA